LTSVRSVFRRVHLILKHLVFATGDDDNGGGDDAVDQNRVDAFGETMARLLSLSVSVLRSGDRQQQPLLEMRILDDLISAAMDACVLLQAHETSSSGWDGVASLGLWPTTMPAFDDGKGSFDLDISTRQQMILLQMAVFDLLHRFSLRTLSRRRKMLLQTSDGSVEGNRTDVDFAGLPVLIHANSSELLLAAVRCVLLSDHGTDDGNDAITLRTKLRALQILALMHDDGDGIPFAASKEGQPLDRGLLLSQAALRHVQNQQKIHENPVRSRGATTAATLSAEFSDLLSLLLSRLFRIDPSYPSRHRKRGCGESPGYDKIRRLAVRTLFDAIMSFDDYSSDAMSRPQANLESVIVRAIWVCLMETVSGGSYRAPLLAFSCDHVQALLGLLLREPDLSVPATGILCILLKGPSSNRSSSIHNLCRVYSLMLAMKNTAGVGDDERGHVVTSLPVGGKKRNERMPLTSTIDHRGRSKRFKAGTLLITGDTKDDDDLSSLEEAIACFFIHARGSAERLLANTTVKKASEDAVISDAACASSALQILADLLFASKIDWSSDNNFHELAIFIAERLLTFMQSIASTTNTARYPYLNSIVACGAFISSIFRRQIDSVSINGYNHGTLRTLLGNIIENAKQEYLVSPSVTGRNTLSNELAFLLSLLGKFENDPPAAVELFPDVVVLFRTNPCRGDTMSGAAAAMLQGMTDNDRTQSVRIKLLRQRIDDEELTTAQPCLRRATLRLLRNSLDRGDPEVRLLMWQSIAWLCNTTSPTDLRRFLVERKTRRTEANSVGGIDGQDLVLWLLEVAFTDPCSTVRDYASREIGKVLLAWDGEATAAFLADEAEWGFLTDHRDSQQHQHVSRRVLSRLFKTVDNLLTGYCSISPSQPSGVDGCSKRIESDEMIDCILGYQRSAVRALLSICHAAVLQYQEHVRIFFEEAFERLLHMSSGPITPERLERTGICIGELCVLQSKMGLMSDFVDEYSRFNTLMPVLISSIITPSTGITIGAPCRDFNVFTSGQRERHYLLLSAIVNRFFPQVSRPPKLLVDSSPLDVEQLIDASQSFVLSKYVVDEDYDALRLFTGFKLFVLAEKRSGEKLRLRSGPGSVDDLVVRPLATKTSKKPQWFTNLEEHARHLCADKPERILPSAFIHGRSQITFFMRTVLRDRLPLKQMFKARGQLILKCLVTELGRSLDPGPALRAIKTAALARPPESSPDTGATKESTGEPGHKAATEWVSSEFMYLLVNCVQFRWSSRPPAERLSSLRCLSALLTLLVPAESPQYISQIMATVNASIDEDAQISDNHQLQRCELRLRAVQVMESFLNLVARHQWETLGQNLASIVVSLIPVLCHSDIPGLVGRSAFYLEESKKAAVELLEWLTRGQLGNNLASFFEEIPFLPSAEALDKVRASLRSYGVDFDNLQVETTPISQHDSSLCGGDVASDYLSSSNGSQGQSARKQAALRKRLGTVCSFLSNENVSIRRVALQHLAALLRANRPTFHDVVDTEGVTSMKRYLTVAYEGTSGSAPGTVTEMVETLLSRCVDESDSMARVLLAECLGEVGAIDERRLEDTNGPTPRKGTAEQSSAPPWRSGRSWYEFQLVSKHLVGALKAASTSADQNKVGYCIQQLLVLLNTPDEGSSNLEGDVVSSHPMKESLRSKLSDEKVLEIVESFWNAEFKESDETSYKPLQPPFFEVAADYNSWISGWCRHMIHRSKEANPTIWSDLFHACRTAVRTAAGQGVAEFLLPILVLDRLCFGNTSDERIVVKEIRDTLAFGAAPDQTKMNWTDRQKAVSIAFTVVETLELWAQEETEKRHQQSSRRKRVASKEPRAPVEDDGFGDEWSAADMRIEDLSKAIPLPLRARAAAKIGMNARALRLLEMASRETVKGRVFDSDSSRDGANVPCNRSRSRAAGFCPPSEMTLMKDVLASLYDYETVSSLDEYNYPSDPKTCARDSIRQKEASGDWEGALQDYERAQQLNGVDQIDPNLRHGALRCLLELGHFDSVLGMVKGILEAESPVECAIPVSSDHAVAFGAEAAWRLGRWDSLSDLLTGFEESREDPEIQYQLSLARLVLGLKKKNQNAVSLELRNARCALMAGLSSSARESYSRSYDQVVRLQTLNEIEETSSLLCSSKECADLGEYVSDLRWDRRLDFLSSTGATTVIKHRLVLSRLSCASGYEGDLFLNLGRRARKKGLHNVAENAFAQAEAAFAFIPAGRAEMEKSSLYLQVAKLKHECGESSVALKMLGLENIETIAGVHREKLLSEARRCLCNALHDSGDKIKNDDVIDIFVRRALRSTRWMVDGSLKNVSEIKGRFRVIHRLSPKWEKGKYEHGIIRLALLKLQSRPYSDSSLISAQILI